MIPSILSFSDKKYLMNQINRGNLIRERVSLYHTEIMQDDIIVRMPTGISSLDPVIDGGIPPGSMIILLGEIGAGNQEFVYSSILSLSLLKRKEAPPSIVYPEDIIYVTFTRMREDIQKEMGLSFKPDMLAQVGTIKFEDLSENYFDATVVPVDWYSHGDIITRLSKRKERIGAIANLSQRLNAQKKNSLIVIDSLTEVASQYADTGSWQELVGYLRGLQRIAKQWNSSIYILLTKQILEDKKEFEIADTADAVITFRWEESSAARRMRIMYFDKFRGVMTHLEERDLVKFAVRITGEGGFEVNNIRVVV